MREALVTGMMALLLVCGSASCSSTRSPQRLAHSWEDPFEPADSGGASHDGKTLAEKWLELDALRAEVLELDARTAALERSFRFRPLPEISPDLSNQASRMMARYLSVRSSLLALRNLFASAAPDDPALRVEGRLLGLHAEIYRSYLDTRLVLTTAENQELIESLDAASPALGLQSGSFRSIDSETRAGEMLDQMRARRSSLDAALAREGSALNEVLAKNPPLAARHRAAMRAFDDALFQAQLILYRGSGLAPDAIDGARRGRVGRWLGRVGARLGRDAYLVQGFIYTKVARLKSPRAQLLTFSPEKVAELEDLLQPGDVILTFTEGYVGNLFLPGVFKHGIVYVGSPDQRRTAGFNDAALWTRVHGMEQFQHLKRVAATGETEAGRPADVVEAVAEGVKFSSLEHLLATHVNRMLILRPRISQDELLDVLVAVFAYVGLQYDFDFDFADPSKLSCTEMIYRVLEGKGSLRFEMTRVRGHWAVTADDIARDALSGPSAPFRVVALADRAPVREDWDATLFSGAEAEPALRHLLGWISQ
jgi:hypothetical protein